MPTRCDHLRTGAGLLGGDVLDTGTMEMATVRTDRGRPNRLGPVMLDVAGTILADDERELLRHPAVGGVILFARNYRDPEQLRTLTHSIQVADERRLLIAADQEGGRVQRFRDGFTRLPAAARFGDRYLSDPREAVGLARFAGWLMAAELLGAGVDFSFAPVLDVEQGISQVIGDRAFADQPEVVATLAGAWLEGVHSAGMAGCGKHYPGHGGVVADSHLELPEDRRPLSDLERCDLLPFRRLISEGLEAVMPAHVRYPEIDPEVAGFSPFWLRTLLRGRLRFEGAIISDDLNMAAAAAGGCPAEAALAALQAGCDLVLICNNRPAACAVLDAVGDWHDEASARRLTRLRARSGVRLEHQERARAARQAVGSLLG